MNKPKVVVPAYPYETGMYWFMTPDEHRSWAQGSYYRGLYGNTSDEQAQTSVALATLFEEIQLVPADFRFPDYNRYMSGDSYYHPDLRLRFTWKDNEWDDVNRTLARQLLNDKTALQTILSTNPSLQSKSEVEHFLCRSIAQIRLADRADAVLLGSSEFGILHDLLLTHIADVLTSSAISKTPWALDPQTMRLLGLMIRARDIDSFAAIRTSKAINEYAEKWREAIATSMSANDPEAKLIDLIKEAREQDELRAKTSGIFQTVGSAANVAGLIPFIGTIASGVAIGSDVATRCLNKAGHSKKWYRIGAKFEEVRLEAFLDRKESA